MPQKKPTNPFYLALLPVGTVFAITAFSYGVMAFRGLDPHVPIDEGLPGLMNQYGLPIMAVELVLLAILTFTAIGTDDFWTRRFEAAKKSATDNHPQQEPAP